MPESNSLLRSGKARLLLFLFVALGGGVFAVSAQSLWIDEAATAVIAMQSNLSGWWQAMRSDGGSSAQMPLYMIYIWGWEKLFGDCEWALRAANLPWLLAGLLALPREKILFAPAVMLSPFVWYYLNEARPYAMQIGASLMILGALWQVSNTAQSSLSKKWFFILGFGIISLCGSSLLGVIWAGAAIVTLVPLIGWRNLMSFLRSHVWPVTITAIILSCLGTYYLWTLKHGNRASDAATTDWKNFVYIIYELFGFAGLGPARSEIRDDGLNVFSSYVPQLILFAALVFSVMISGLGSLKENLPAKKMVSLAAIVAVPVILLFSAGCLLHFRVLGRHFAPLFAVCVCLLALGAERLWRKNIMCKMVVLGCFSFFLASDFSLRFGARHAKEDYRDAAVIAKKELARGQTVWWNANINGAKYYRVPLTMDTGEPGAALLVINPSENFLTNAALPQTIISSRPDAYDSGNSLSHFVREKPYVKTQDLPAFSVWEKE